MIIDFFIVLIEKIVGMIPPLPNGIIKPFEGVYNLFELANYYIPCSEIMTCIVLYFVFVKYQLGVRIIKFISSFIKIG